MFMQSFLLADCWLCGISWWLPLLLSIIPFLLGWWFQSFTTRKWRLRAEALENEIRDLKGQIKGLEKDLEDCKYARNRLDGEVAMLKGRNREMQYEVEGLKEDLKSSKVETEEANSKIIALEDAAKAALLATPLASSDDTNEGEKDIVDEVVSQIDDTSSSVESISENLKEEVGDTSSNLDDLSSSLADMSDDAIEDINDKVDDASDSIEDVADANDAAIDDISSSADEAISNLDESISAPIDKDTGIIEDQIASSGDEADALVSGIIDEVDSGADTVAGAGVAAGLVGSGLSEDALAAGKAVFGYKIKQDDLKLIEGVGPKIESLLKDAGLDTWSKVANASADNIKKILEDAGPRYRLADPTTWPMQAKYAAGGEWEALKTYQDKLDGGRLA
ncbi:MAG: hypothetical protein AAGK97_07765 [Bacteroidota bacterium]